MIKKMNIQKYDYTRATLSVAPYSPRVISLLCMEARSSLLSIVPHIDKNKVFFDVDGETVWKHLEKIGSTLVTCEKFFALIKEKENENVNNEDEVQSEDNEEHPQAFI